MPKLGTIDEYEIVSSGILISYKDSRAAIFPFDDDKEFELEIIVKIAEEGVLRARTVIDWDDREYPALRITRPYKLGRPSGSSRPIIFASDGETHFYLNYTLSLVGSRDKYSFLFAFNILKGSGNE